MKISYQDKELLCSGTFITFGREQTILEIKYKTDSVKLIFEFVTSQETQGAQTRTEIVDPPALKFTLINFDSPLGTRSTVPWEIGKTLNRTIYLLCDIVDLQGSEGLKKVTYSIYLGPEIING